MMDYDKLIERLHKEAYGSDIEELLLDASTAIETLRSDNAKLKDSRDRWKKCAENFSAGVEQRDREDDALQEENEKLRADLARVTAERDAAVECLRNKCPFCRKYLTCQGRTINNDCWEFFGLKED